MRHMTGLQLRHVPPAPIGSDRDLFEVVPGGSDRKIGDDQVVEIRDGLRFFTAPAQINPGERDLYRTYEENANKLLARSTLIKLENCERYLPPEAKEE